ncbi:hypothetical protein Acr_00g0080130 [Actinidia rufa]|uniref:Uncharacterized protein n=1 Tax=Actinidia rufa TaxID=165716 RepID=A0A7J0DWF4_9ERIC|nr:hypothetical protein Acr_00g0080130 [Actinidia rufa]
MSKMFNIEARQGRCNSACKLSLPCTDLSLRCIVVPRVESSKLAGSLANSIPKCRPCGTELKAHGELAQLLVHDDVALEKFRTDHDIPNDAQIKRSRLRKDVNLVKFDAEISDGALPSYLYASVNEFRLDRACVGHTDATVGASFQYLGYVECRVGRDPQFVGNAASPEPLESNNYLRAYEAVILKAQEVQGEVYERVFKREISRVGDNYDRQVAELHPSIYQESWLTCLKELKISAEISAEHSVFELAKGVTSSSSNSNSLDLLSSDEVGEEVTNSGLEEIRNLLVMQQVQPLESNNYLRAYEAVILKAQEVQGEVRDRDASYTAATKAPNDETTAREQLNKSLKDLGELKKVACGSVYERVFKREISRVGDNYDRQVAELHPSIYQESWLTCLKELKISAEISAEHSVFELAKGVTSSSSNSNSLDLLSSDEVGEEVTNSGLEEIRNLLVMQQVQPLESNNYLRAYEAVILKAQEVQGEEAYLKDPIEDGEGKSADGVGDELGVVPATRTNGAECGGLEDEGKWVGDASQVIPPRCRAF